MKDTALIKYDAACRALAAAKSVAEAQHIRYSAEAMRAYARQAKDRELEINAAEIRIRAERRVGELIKAQKDTVGLAKGGGSGSNQYKRATASKRDAVALTLKDAGIDNHLADRARRLAAMSASQFEQLLGAWHDRIQREKERVTTTLLRDDDREETRQANRATIETVSTLHPQPCTGDTFATLVIDPPWDYSDEDEGDLFGRVRPTYATLPFADLLAYPVAGLAAEDCHCYLWITNRSLPKGFALLEAWGFRYVTCLTWCKPSFGMGRYFRGSTEQILFGVKGSQPLKRQDVGTWFLTGRDGKHSTKPDAFYALVESCSPGPYLDLFGRKIAGKYDRPGWRLWGEDSATTESVVDDAELSI